MNSQMSQAGWQHLLTIIAQAAFFFNKKEKENLVIRMLMIINSLIKMSTLATQN